MLTADVNINIAHVKSRKVSGGHDVPKEKILLCYKRALDLFSSLIEVCDICHIYDNSKELFCIFKKRKNSYFFWKEEQVKQLVQIEQVQ